MNNTLHVYRIKMNYDNYCNDVWSDRAEKTPVLQIDFALAGALSGFRDKASRLLHF